jgi:hypothetical protein
MKKLFYRWFSSDQIRNGLLVGLSVPLLALGILFILLDSVGISTLESDGIHFLRPRTLALFCLCSNIIWMNGFNSMRWFQSMRGVAISTFILVVCWLIKFSTELF